MIEFLNKNSDKLNSDDYPISELKIVKGIVLFGPDVTIDGILFSDILEVTPG